MKRIYSIIMLCLMTAATLVSCSDSEKFNTGNATVAFKNADLSIKESKGIFYIPIVASGEQNGPIEVSIEVSANDANCKEDENFMITSKHIIIPADKKEVNVEIKTIDDRIINNDRHFTLSIASANGASINSSNSKINIALVDNDDIPYERMAGTWIVTATNILSDTGNDPISWETELTIVEDESDPSYGSTITSAPWAIFNGEIPVFDEEGQVLSHQMIFHHNESSGKTTVDMKMGSYMASNLNFGMQPVFDENGKETGKVDCTNATIRSATTGITGLMYSGTISGVVNDTFDEIKFSNPIYEIIFSTAGAPFQYYGGFDNVTLKLKK